MSIGLFTLVIFQAIICIAIFAYSQDNEPYKYENYDFWNYVNLISCAINVLAGYLSMFSRLNLYFSVTTIIFLPNILKSFNINKFLKCFIYIGFIVLYFTSLSSDGAVPWTSCF